MSCGVRKHPKMQLRADKSGTSLSSLGYVSLRLSSITKARVIIGLVINANAKSKVSAAAGVLVGAELLAPSDSMLR